MLLWRLSPLLLLIACNTPGPQMRDAPLNRVTAGQDTFDMRRKGDVIQAIRTNARFLPRDDEVAENASAAMEQLTGCKVAWLTGDPALMWAGLSCNGAAAPPMPPPPSATSFICDVFRTGDFVTLECET